MFSKEQRIPFTGVSSGIGRIIDLQYNVAGTTVLVCGRNMERLSDKARGITGQNFVLAGGHY